MARGRAGLVAALVACGLLAALVLPTTAPAARGLVTGFHADEYVNTGPPDRALWLDRTVNVGGEIARITLGWERVAGSERAPDPRNPGSASYDFDHIDGGVRDLKARGVKVLLTVGPDIPLWAEAPGRPASIDEGRWRPANPSDFADFVQAVAARYSGNFDPDGGGPASPLPAVDAVEIWNEPNGEPWLSQQYGGTPDYYRAMLNSSYQGVKAVNPGMLVVTGGTGPYGDPPGGPYPPSGGRVRPVEFWQRVLCVHPTKGKKKKGKKSRRRFARTQGCAAPAMFDVFAHHPIDNTGGGPHRSGPHKNDASTPDLGRVVRVLRGAERAGTVSPGGRHPVWVTEFWWDSKPPNRSGAPLAVHARWIQESLYMFWKAGASVAINFMLRDQDTRPDVRAGFQAGPFFNDGRPKPASTAFRFPFVTERINERSLRAWGKAPAAGKLVIERKQGNRWVAVKKLRVRQGEVFRAKLRLRGAQRVRAKVGREQSLVWKQAGSGKAAKASSDGGPSTATLSLIAVIVFLVAAVLLRGWPLRRRRRAESRRSTESRRAESRRRAERRRRTRGSPDYGS